MCPEENFQWKQREEQLEKLAEDWKREIEEIEKESIVEKPYKDQIIINDELTEDLSLSFPKKHKQQIEEENEEQNEDFNGWEDHKYNNIDFRLNFQPQTKDVRINDEKSSILESEKKVNLSKEQQKESRDTYGEKSIKNNERNIIGTGKINNLEKIEIERMFEECLGEIITREKKIQKEGVKKIDHNKFSEKDNKLSKEKLNLNKNIFIKRLNKTKFTEISIPEKWYQDTKAFTKFRTEYMQKFNLLMSNSEKRGQKAPDHLLLEYSNLSNYLLKNCFILQKKNKSYFYLEDCYTQLKAIENLPLGKIGYEHVGRQGKDRHYTFVKDIEENMVFKEIQGKIYARWRKPQRKYTRTDGASVQETFFWFFDRVVLKRYDYNGNYKLARKIRSAFRNERLEGRDYFILKKNLPFIKKIICAKYHELDRTNEIDRFRNMSRNALANCLEAVMKAKKGGFTTGGLSIPLKSNFEIYYVDGKKLWKEVFRAF